MIRFFFFRTVSLALTLFVAAFLIFFMLNILPGDPARFMLGINATQEAVAVLRTQLGLDQGFFVRFWAWITGLLSGDMGLSFLQRVNVLDLITQRLSVSLPLALVALLLAVLFGFPIGFLAAQNHQKPLDGGLMILAQTGMAVPNFWFAMLLVIPFAVWWRWVPSGGFIGWQADFWASLKALVLPAIALAVPQGAILARVFRTALVDIKSEDFMRTARAKGMTQSQALWHHGLRNALVPVMTILGLQLAFLIAGTVIVENVFFLPGLGRLIFNAITERDLIVVQNAVLMLVIAVTLIMYVIDLIFALIDPRIRRQE